MYLKVSKQELQKEEEAYASSYPSDMDPMEEVKAACTPKHSDERHIESSNNYLRDTVASKARADSIAGEVRRSREGRSAEAATLRSSGDSLRQRYSMSRSQSPEREEVKMFLKSELKYLDSEIGDE